MPLCRRQASFLSLRKENWITKIIVTRVGFWAGVTIVVIDLARLLLSVGVVPVADAANAGSRRGSKDGRSYCAPDAGRSWIAQHEEQKAKERRAAKRMDCRRRRPPEVRRLAKLPSLADGILFRNFAHRDAQRAGNTLAVGWVGLQAVADVTGFDLFGGIAHGSGGILKERVPLLGFHHPE